MCVDPMWRLCSNNRSNQSIVGQDPRRYYKGETPGLILVALQKKSPLGMNGIVVDGQKWKDKAIFTVFYE